MELNGALRRSLQCGLLVMICAALLYLCMHLFRHQQAPEAPSPNRQISAKAPSPFYINGFQFTSNQAGHQRISIQADRFELKKKKIGIMRFGLMKEALFINANIDLYSDRPGNPLSGKRSKHSTENEPLSFKHAMSAKTLASLPMKKVVALQFSPIRMRLHHSGRVEVVVTARRASINPKTREMVFTGDVRWNRGGHILYADYLTTSLEENTIRVPNAYRIDHQGNVHKGRRMNFDLLLNRQPHQPDVAVHAET